MPASGALLGSAEATVQWIRESPAWCALLTAAAYDAVRHDQRWRVQWNHAGARNQRLAQSATGSDRRAAARASTTSPKVAALKGNHEARRVP